ncbi:MAG: hypothetical protein H6868_04370 [Rhodospirillales bacterium]|nr:hypothetical protein [Rhodospirillales bacterium]
MGKSFELLGMAAFNVMLAVILSATFFHKVSPTDAVQTLTEANVDYFIREVSAISSGEKEDMDSYKITSYFLKHINDDSQFVTVLKYAMDGGDPEEQSMEMGKMDFISHILQGQKAMDRHETAVTVEYIKISDDKKSAKVITQIRERGLMPTLDDFGEQTLVPVTGVSYCDQVVSLNDDHDIQMDGAECTTYMDINHEY